MPKTSHLEKQKKTYQANETLVRENTGMSMYDYYSYQFELGCKFLEHLYPGQEFRDYYVFTSQNKAYWAWWEIEFKAYEMKVIERLREGCLMSRLTHNCLMKKIVTDGYVETSYQENFLKELSTEIF